MKFLVLFFLFSFVGINLSYARKIIELEPILVTPYRTAVEKGISPAATEIIFLEQAERQGKFTFTDAVKNIPSLSHATTGGRGGDTSLYIRGAQAYHTQVMLDGIKLYDPMSTQGYFYAYNYMSLDNVDRVEVAKGPYSSLYGSGSIGGTINLIPRQGKGKPTFSYFQEGGSYNTLRGIFRAQGEIDKLNYALSTSWTNIRGFYALRKDDYPEKDPYRDVNSSLNLQYQLTDNLELGLITDYTYAKYHYDDSFALVDADNYVRFYQGVGGLTFDHEVTDLFSYKITGAYTRTYRKHHEEVGLDRWSDAKTYQVKWQGNYQILPENEIIIGFDYLREAGESNSEPKNTVNTQGYYIENIFIPWENLFFSTSYRREEHSQFGGVNTFSAAAGYHIEETGTKLKASFGQGFRAPSLYELYGQPYTCPWTATISPVGNPDLAPERSRSFEAGLEQDIFNNVKIGTTYFQANVKNFIEWVTDPITFSGQYQNVDKAKMYGIESFLELDITDNTLFRASYTYLDATKRPAGTRLLRRPSNKVTWSLSTQWDKLSVYCELSYVGNRMDGFSGDIKLKSYLLANMNFNYQVNENLEFSLRLENILNRDYELVENYQTPKFSWYAGTKIKF